MRMTTLTVEERIVCRSMVSVRLTIAGIFLNKEYTVMQDIACMEDYRSKWRITYVVSNNDRLFSVIVFLCAFSQNQKQ